MKRRAISLLLAACMMCGLLTVGASAASSDATGAVETMKALGIMVGDETGNMNLSGNVTRAQFVKMMTAASTYRDSVGAGYGYSLFKDVKSDHWASEYIKLAVEQGWITGYVDGTFRPNTNITRAQACVIVNRALGRSPDEERLLDEDEMITWPDNNPEDWFYADMQEATNSHDYTWVTVSGDKVEKWTEKLEQRDWAALEHAWSTAHSAPGGEVTK